MPFAVIQTGGKQYKVAVGNKLKVEKLDVEEGKAINFDQVLLTDDGTETKLGTPTLVGATVTGKVLKQGRHPKIDVIHFRAKTNLRKKYGHRQPYTEVEIASIA